MDETVVGLLDTIVQLCVVFDVTQISYQWFAICYQAHLVSKIVFIVYQAFLEITLQILCLPSSLRHQRNYGRR